MFEERNEVSPVTEGTPRWLAGAVVVLAAVSLLALGIGWNAAHHAKNAEQVVAAQVQILHNAEALTQRLTQAEEHSAQAQGQLNVVTSRLKLTQSQLSSAKRQAKQIKEQYGKQLASVETSLASKASSDDVKNLSGDVSGVKSDLDA